MMGGVLYGWNRDVVNDPGELGIGGPVVADRKFVAEQGVRGGEYVGRHRVCPDLAAAGGAGHDGGGDAARQDVEDVGGQPVQFAGQPVHDLRADVFVAVAKQLQLGEQVAA